MNAQLAKVIGGLTKSFIVSKKFLVNNAPLILGIKSSIGIISTAVLAVRATSKSINEIEEEEKRCERSLTTKEKVKLCWPNYIFVAVEATSSIVCGIESNVLYSKKIKSLTNDNTRLNELVLTYQELIDQVRKKFGKEFGDKLLDNVKENLNAPKEENKDNPISVNYILDNSQNGEVLCTEPYTNQEFLISRDRLDYIANQIQAIHLNNATHDIETTVNDALYSLELPTSKILGDAFGWKFDHDRKIDIVLGSTLLKGDRPAIKIEFDPQPDLI